MSALLIIAVCIGVAIGAAVGFFRKFTKTSFCGVTALVTVLAVRALGGAVKKTTSGYGLAMILSAVIILMVLSAVTEALKKLLERAVEARKKLSHYERYDDKEENQALILAAVDSGDRKQYKRELKKGKKIKESAGGWGVLDGVLGSVNGAFNALVGLGAVILCLLTFIDLSHIGFLQSAFSAPLASASWKGLGHCLAFDLPLVCVLALSLRAGYNSGISSVIWLVVVLGLLVGFGFASWAIACSDACAGAVSGLQNGLLASFAGTLGDKTAVVARVIIALIIFLLSAVFVIIAGIFLPKLTEKFRENKVFTAVDGVIGAIVLCAVMAVILTAVGGVAYTLHDLDFMAEFNGYAFYSRLGDGMYSHSPMASLFKNLPLRGWFGALPEQAAVAALIG